MCEVKALKCEDIKDSLVLLTQSIGLLAKRLVMGGPACLFLELMLFIGFKYTPHWLRHGHPLHLAYSAQYY